MMRARKDQIPILYDVTRLALRVARGTPNGIDRVDYRFAQHFLAPELQGQGVLLGPFGPRKIANSAANRVIGVIADRWREAADPGVDASYQRLLRWLKEGSDECSKTAAALSAWKTTAWSLCRIVRHVDPFGREGPLFSRGLRTAAQARSVYLNVSQFPTFSKRYFRWLDRRPDVRAAFFVHDLLPLQYPEFFPSIEHRVHTARLDVIARYASGAIVSSAETKAALQGELGARGRPELPIQVFPLAAEESFHTATAAAAELDGADYFLTVGTIEPRKNHLMLLNVWRDMAEKLGSGTPKLVIVGAVGWDCENVFDMLERCRVIQPHVILVRGLSTPALRRVLARARALLMPSFAEGFGLPVTEALAAKTPVIASDIAPFRRLGAASLILIDPTDGPGWRAAILQQHHTQTSVEMQPYKDVVTLEGISSWGDMVEFLCSLPEAKG